MKKILFSESLKDKSDKYLEELSNNLFLKVKIIDAELLIRKYKEMKK